VELLCSWGSSLPLRGEYCAGCCVIKFIKDGSSSSRPLPLSRLFSCPPSRRLSLSLSYWNKDNFIHNIPCYCYAPLLVDFCPSRILLCDHDCLVWRIVLAKFWLQCVTWKELDCCSPSLQNLFCPHQIPLVPWMGLGCDDRDFELLEAYCASLCGTKCLSWVVGYKICSDLGKPLGSGLSLLGFLPPLGCPLSWGEGGVCALLLSFFSGVGERWRITGGESCRKSTRIFISENISNYTINS
jgi:hypothetical protein